jgi:hypothetical protein
VQRKMRPIEGRVSGRAVFRLLSTGCIWSEGVGTPSAPRSGVVGRDGVRAICRNEREAVRAILDTMPSYFRAVATELSA